VLIFATYVHLNPSLELTKLTVRYDTTELQQWCITVQMLLPWRQTTHSVSCLLITTDTTINTIYRQFHNTKPLNLNTATITIPHNAKSK